MKENFKVIGFIFLVTAIFVFTVQIGMDTVDAEKRRRCAVIAKAHQQPYIYGETLCYIKADGKSFTRDKDLPEFKGEK